MSTCSSTTTPVSCDDPASFSSSVDPNEFSSSPPNDLPPEGYLILTFNKDKKAKVKAAAFADVSEAGLQDDEAAYEDDEEELAAYSMDSSVVSRSPSSLTPLTISTALQIAPSTGLSRLTAVATAACLGVDVSQLSQTSSTATHISSASLSSSSSSSLLRDNVRRFTYPDGDTHYDLLSCSLKDMQANAPPSIEDCRRTSSLVYESSLPNIRRPRFCFSSTNISSQSTLSRKMLRCEECGKYYRNTYSLHHHICLKRKDVWKKGDVPSQLIDGQMIYFCPICRKPFKWLGNLTRHYYVHTGQRFFKCDICQKEFFSAYQVRRHMNSHTGYRLNCEICKKPFTCQYACAWHKRQHSEYVE